MLDVGTFVKFPASAAKAKVNSKMISKGLKFIFVGSNDVDSDDDDDDDENNKNVFNAFVLSKKARYYIFVRLFNYG